MQKDRNKITLQYKQMPMKELLALNVLKTS